MKIFVYPPALGAQREVREVGRVENYDDIKRVVTPLLDGGDLEHVSVLFEQRPADMFVDEDGARKGLPENPEATAIYQAWSIQRGSKAADLSKIYGVAIIFEKLVWR